MFVNVDVYDTFLCFLSFVSVLMQSIVLPFTRFSNEWLVISTSEKCYVYIGTITCHSNYLQILFHSENTDIVCDLPGNDSSIDNQPYSLNLLK